ncbi:hypothetical protein D3C76_1359240 [compost metagenome]
MPADLLVDLGAQAQGPGHSRRWDGAIADGAPLLKVRPDDHDLTGAEVLAVGNGFFLGLAARA